MGQAESWRSVEKATLLEDALPREQFAVVPKT
jgi:hypothetical protein